MRTTTHTSGLIVGRRGNPKYERAALRWLERYLSEGTPSPRDAAKVTASLAEVEIGRR